MIFFQSIGILPVFLFHDSAVLKGVCFEKSFFWINTIHWNVQYRLVHTILPRFAPFINQASQRSCFIQKNQIKVVCCRCISNMVHVYVVVFMYSSIGSSSTNGSQEEHMFQMLVDDITVPNAARCWNEVSCFQWAGYHMANSHMSTQMDRLAWAEPSRWCLCQIRTHKIRHYIESIIEREYWWAEE